MTTRRVAFLPLRLLLNNLRNCRCFLGEAFRSPFLPSQHDASCEHLRNCTLSTKWDGNDEISFHSLRHQSPFSPTFTRLPKRSKVPWKCFAHEHKEKWDWQACSLSINSIRARDAWNLQRIYLRIFQHLLCFFLISLLIQFTWGWLAERIHSIPLSLSRPLLSQAHKAFRKSINARTWKAAVWHSPGFRKFIFG